jgi:hypothetical protein
MPPCKKGRVRERLPRILRGPIKDGARISFGDNVRVRTDPETTRLGVAGLKGQVYGETTPSITGVEVIGEVRDDYAINVVFEERSEDLWFSPELLEFVDHAPGATLGSGARRWTRNTTGEWIEEAVTPPDRPKE